MTADEFRDVVLGEANEFYLETGKWPNELYIGSNWSDAFEQCVDGAKSYGLCIGSPMNRVKHWWFMGMRCFAEFWTHGVDWTKETEELKLQLGIA